MRANAVALAALAMAASCSHRAVTLNAPARPVNKKAAAARTAVAANMGRQISNAVDAGDGDIEARALRARLNAEPGNLDVRLTLAARYDAMGFPEIALEHYRLAAERFPDDATVTVRLARQLRGQGSEAEAVRVLEGYTGLHNDAPAEVHAWLGILRDELGELAAGERAHRRAVAVAGEDAGEHGSYLRNNLGQNLLLQGRHSEAAEEFRAALRADKRSAIARNNLGVALAALPGESGESGEAVLQWKSIADAATAHNNLAAVLIEEGRFAEARHQLSLALGYKPDSAAALSNLALVAELDGQPAALDAHRAPSLWRRFAAVVFGAEEKRVGKRTGTGAVHRSDKEPTLAPVSVVRVPEKQTDEAPPKPGERASSRE